MIPIQHDESRSFSGTGKIEPADGEAWAFPMGGAPLETESFAAFVHRVSGHKSNTGAVPGVFQEPSECQGKSGVDPLCADSHILENLYRGSRKMPEEEIPQPGAIPPVMVSNDMAEKGDSETGLIPPAFKEMCLIQTDFPETGLEGFENRPLSMDAELLPTAEKEGIKALLQPVLNDPGKVSTDMAGFKGLETTGPDLVSGVVTSSRMEGVPRVIMETENLDSPVPGTSRMHDLAPLMGKHGLSGGMNSDPSPGVTMILSPTGKEKDPRTVFLSRTIRTGAELFEKVPPQGIPLSDGPDVSRIFPITRDSGQPPPSDGNKSGMQNLLFEVSGTRQNTNQFSVKLDVPVSGAIQKSDSEYLIQAEKMIWPLAGPNGTIISEKGDAMETSRLQLEPRGIHPLADIIKKAVWRNENGESQARIQLKPAFFGNLHLNVIINQMKVTVEIRAETLVYRDFLEMNLHLLKAELQESGLEIEKIDVLVDTDLNNQQEQGRASAHKQTHRVNGHSKEMDVPTNEEPSEPQTMTLSGGEENRVDCFV